MEQPRAEFRIAGLAAVGPLQTLCAGCRGAGYWWCRGHEEAHRVAEFGVRAVVDDIVVYKGKCRRREAEEQWKRRGCPTHQCEACGKAKPGSEFPHVVRGYCVCRSCVEDHPTDRWCRGCGWKASDGFTQGPTARERNSFRVRCDMCYSAYLHNTTVDAIVAKQGSTKPECAACGSTDRLAVDHDHACCSARSKSCGRCVRGYLCRSHNVAEGLLVTSESARQLAEYMARFEAP